MNVPATRGWLFGPALLISSLLFLLIARPGPLRAQTDPQSLQQAFAGAANEFHVPEAVLLAVAYNESRWEQHDGAPSTSGGYGIMHLVEINGTVIAAGKGDGSPATHLLPVNDATLHTLTTAAQLIGQPPATLKQDAQQNLRGGAALLAQYARETTGTLPADPADWYGAVARYSEAGEAIVARDFADQVYETMRQGVTRTLSSGQEVTLAAMPVIPNRATAAKLALPDHSSTDADCPRGLDCRFVPAAYQQNNPNDPSDYGNYDLALRPTDGLDIQYIVIHDTELPYQTTISLFQNPYAYVSSHYVIRSADGQITQMVDNRNVAWHAGNWYVNTHAIGIEHEGFAVEGASWYSEQLYHASARLVRYLANQYGIPLDRAHIVGHDNVPGPTPSFQSTMHWDPGPFWDWAHYMALVGAPLTPGGPHSNLVTINPNFATNQPPLTYCDPTCHPLPPQGASFVYLRTAPDPNAPLLDDPALPGPGTTHADDWGDKAATGQQFYRFATQDDWDGIYFGGQQAWFYNPRHNANTLPGRGLLVQPKAGLSTIPVYGRAYPEAAAYPPGIPVQAIVPLRYSIPAGQIYVAADLVRADYYYAPTFTLDPHDHTVVEGQTQYYLIYFNHRVAYLQATDVDVVPGP
jgi:hypothetical protein